MAPPDPAPMELDGMPEHLGTARELGFVALETTDDGDAHDYRAPPGLAASPLTGHTATRMSLRSGRPALTQARVPPLRL